MKLDVTDSGGCLIENFYKFNADRTVFIEDICAAQKAMNILQKFSYRQVRAYEYLQNDFTVQLDDETERKRRSF